MLLAAMLGLVFMALGVSLLFSMQSYFQQREQIVNYLMSRAGSPASGVVLLLRYRELDISSQFVQCFCALGILGVALITRNSLRLSFTGNV